MNNNLPSPPQAKSSYTPILLTLLFSFLLAGGTCFGFLNTFSVNRNSTWSTICGGGFIVCVAAFLISLLSLVIKVLRDIIRGAK